jgi:hypothetical protein
MVKSLEIFQALGRNESTMELFEGKKHSYKVTYHFFLLSQRRVCFGDLNKIYYISKLREPI